MNSETKSTSKLAILVMRVALVTMIAGLVVMLAYPSTILGIGRVIVFAGLVISIIGSRMSHGKTPYKITIDSIKSFKKEDSNKPQALSSSAYVNVNVRHIILSTT